MTPYCSIAEAHTYFADRLNTESWDDSTDTNRLKALKQATRAIDHLNFVGERSSQDQENQFPRDDDISVPQDIKNACAELALSLLGGIDPDVEYENLFATRFEFANAKVSYDRGSVPLHIVAGIVSLTAWRYLVPYLRDTQSVRINKR